MIEIKTEDEYRKAITSDKSLVINKNLEIALDVRKFEIELYWKRATYFWTFISIIFTGYFALDIANIPNYLETKFILSFIGLIFSLAWYLVNRGNKYWQINWEVHVALLEDENIGSLFKTTLSSKNFSKSKLSKAYPYSVSKINQSISIFIFIVWIILYLNSLGNIFYIHYKIKLLPGYDNGTLMILIIFLTLFFSWQFIFKCTSSNEEEKQQYILIKREINDFIIDNNTNNTNKEIG